MRDEKGKFVKGHKVPEEWIELMRKKKFGRNPWNKGEKGIYSEETLRKMSNSQKGIAPWNKGIKGIMKPNSGSFKKGNNKWTRNERIKYGKIARKIVKNKWKVILTPDFVIHHIDGNIKNNEDINLVVMGRRLHARLHYEQRRGEDLLQSQLGA